MRVAFSLLTLQPGAAGGAETYVRGLLGAFGQGGSGVALEVLRQRLPQCAHDVGVAAPFVVQLREPAPEDRMVVQDQIADVRHWVSFAGARTTVGGHGPSTRPLPI